MADGERFEFEVRKALRTYSDGTIRNIFTG